MQARQAHVIMLTSGKGGTGKSVVSSLLGAAIAQRNLQVLLIELGGGPRTIDYPTGVYGNTVYDIGDVFAGRCEAQKAIQQSPLYKGLNVVCAPYSGGVVQPQALLSLISSVRSSYDIIILDVASGNGVPFKSACSVANSAIVTITPDSVSANDGNLVATALRSKTRLPSRLLINRVPKKLSNCGIVDLDECIDIVGLQLIGVIPESSVIKAAACTGSVLPEESMEHAAFKALASRICGTHVPLVYGL